MKENYDVLEKMIPLFNCPDKFSEMEDYLLKNSNLPGPRSNLTLAYKFAACFEKKQFGQELTDLLFGWAGIPIEKAPVNDRREYLPFCAVLALGAHYLYADKKNKSRIMNQFKSAMNDGRWRIRESAAMGLQYIAEKDFTPIREYFTRWYPDSNYLEKRAFLATLAHPPILKEKEIVRFSLRMSEDIIKELLQDSKERQRSEDFTVLSKGLRYCLSVFVTELPDDGFALLKRYSHSENKHMIKIIKSNLGKSRLTKKYPQRVNEILAGMNR